jgi:hypothetical protein
VKAPLQQDARAEGPRRPAGDLIDAVLDNMRRNLETLKYSTLAPSRYVIYLHPAEYARLEGIIPKLQEESVRALADELAKLNNRSFVRRRLEWLIPRRDPAIESAGTGWHVEFLCDADGEVGEGDFIIDSELLLPSQPELGAGERTRRITTVRAGQRTTTREQTVTPVQSIEPRPVLARIQYTDDSGQQTRDVVKDSMTIGRGGIAYPVDIRLVSSADVSREHARLRRDPKTGRFFIIDLSSLGTTLNGRHIPRGYEDVDGTKRENGAETPVPDRARIGLADTVYLDFQRVE